MGLEALRVTTVSVPLKAGCNEAEGGVSLRPQVEGSTRVTGDVEYHLLIIGHPLDAGVEGLLGDLVEVSAVGEVDCQPVGTRLGQDTAFSKVKLRLDVV